MLRLSARSCSRVARARKVAGCVGSSSSEPLPSLDGQTEGLQLFLFHPERRGSPVITFDQQAERAVARLTNRLSLQTGRWPKDVLGVKHQIDSTDY